MENSTLGMNTPRIHKPFLFTRLYIESKLDEIMIDGYNVKVGFMESDPGCFDHEKIVAELEGKNCILRVLIPFDTIENVEFNDKQGVEEFIKCLWEGPL